MSIKAIHHDGNTKSDLIYVSDNVLKHPTHKTHIEIITKNGKTYILESSYTKGQRNESHIYPVHPRGYVLNGDILEWSSEQIDGIKNHKKPSSRNTRKLEIVESNFFNKLLDEYFNRE